MVSSWTTALDCHNPKISQIGCYLPLSLRVSSATVLVSVRTLSVAACMSLWWVSVLGSSRLPCTYYKPSTILMHLKNKQGTAGMQLLIIFIIMYSICNGIKLDK